MTPPRQILPGQLFEIDARTLARQFRFLPSAHVNALMRYLFAVAAERYNITVFALVVMVNHYHLVGLDVDGRLPDFARYLHSLVARALNALQARDDKLWSGDGVTLLRPQSPDDLWRRLLYVSGNPMAADLVERLADFPGVATLPRDAGTSRTIARPTWFFCANGSMPACATFRVGVPEALGLSRDAYVAEYTERLCALEQKHRVRRRDAGRAVLGAKRMRQLRVGAVPKSRETWFRLRPTVAAIHSAQRIAALRALKAFREGYAIALAAWRGGDHHAVFPAGSWWMPRFAGAVVAPP